jgi:hypothetical protein
MLRRQMSFMERIRGSVDYELAADGARCSLRIPAKWLNAMAAPAAELN